MSIIVPERLIGRSPAPHIGQRHLIVRLLVPRPALESPSFGRTISGPQGALDPLVLIRILVPEILPRRSVTVASDPVAPSRATARAEEPEEAGGEGEEHAEPDGDIDVTAEGAMNVVSLEGAVEGARENRIEDG